METGGAAGRNGGRSNLVVLKAITSHRIVAYRKHACLPRHRSWVRIPVGRPLGFLFTGSSPHLNPVPAEGQGGTPDQPRRTVAAPPAPYLWMNYDGGFTAMPGNALNARA